ncbi:MAG: PAS domain-containing protein, partial [Planctomycetota bacterium]
MLDTGEAFRVEERVTLPGLGPGERIFQTEKQPYRMPDGSIGGVIGVARDITDIRRALEELRTSDERLSFALSAASVGYWDHDMVSDRVYYADTWFTMLGYEPGELSMTVECFWDELLHPDDRERVAAAHESYVRGDLDVYDVECRLRRKDGGWHWIRDIGSIIERDHERRPTRMVGVHVDVDDRQRQQDLLETALVAANEGLWEWNVPDNTCYFDDMWFKLLGYDPGELPMEFETWEELCHPDDLESAQLALGRYLRGESPSYAFEHRLWTKTGSWKWVLGTGRIIERDSQGRPTRVVGVNMDIDDRMHAAETLEYALDAAEAANLAKSQFLANMSHEIRTPMTAIVGYADLMVNDPDLIADQQKMQETAGVIQRNGEHLLALINDILDLSKIDAGKMKAESVRTDLGELIYDVYNLHRARASHKGIRLEIQQRDALPDAVMADPVRIRQVLMNLVNNAIKFTE